VRRGLAHPGPQLAGVASALAGCPLAKYREPLPGKGIVVAAPAGVNRYLFTMHEITRKLHPDLPPTPFWEHDDGSGLAGQAGSFGMVIARQSGTPTDNTVLTEGSLAGAVSTCQIVGGPALALAHHKMGRS